MTMKLASLFDGSGGFPLAATSEGITPIWASEIERYPKEVSSKNFPEMKHLGDVRQINGAETEPVDIITFGSPCQDLSIAGKRKGLSGNRSGLFYEAIRIVKEMRKATNGQYPKFLLWENVTGALNSNKGKDFKEVLRQFATIEEGDNVPDLPDFERWPNAGQILGRGWSFAWRVFDAQYFGVPQRRRRIYAVWHFGRIPSAEILFERKSLQRNSSKSRTEEEKASGNTGASAEESNSEVGKSDDSSREDKQFRVYDCRGLGQGEVTCTLSGDHANRVTNTTPIVINQIGGSGEKAESAKVTAPVRAEQANSPMCVCIGNEQLDQLKLNDKVGTLDCMHDQKCVLYASSNATFFSNWEKDIVPTQNESQWKDPHRIAHPEPLMLNKTAQTITCSSSSKGFSGDREVMHGEWFVKQPVPILNIDYIVRRLSPTECARLQGFPDNWGKNVEHYSESAEYRMWGNGIALPCAEFVMKGIKKVYDFENRNH